MSRRIDLLTAMNAPRPSSLPEVSIIAAARDAFGFITSPAFRQILLESAGVALAFLAVGWIALLYVFSSFVAPALLAALGIATDSWLATALTVAAGVTLAFFLVTAVLLFVSRLYLRRLLQGVQVSIGDFVLVDPENRVPVSTLSSTVRFLARAIPVYVLLSPLTLVLGFGILTFGAANAYLLGRHHFLMVAEEVVSREEALALYRANRLTIILAGALIVLLSSVPLINLMAPAFAPTFMSRIYAQLSPRSGIRAGDVRA